MGPAFECPPEVLPNRRVIYRCLYGHMHNDPSTAWGCGGPESNDSGASDG